MAPRLLAARLLTLATAAAFATARSGLHRLHGELLRREVFGQENPQSCWEPLASMITVAEAARGGLDLNRYYSALVGASVHRVFDKKTKKLLDVKTMPADVAKLKRCPKYPAADRGEDGHVHPLDAALPGLILASKKASIAGMQLRTYLQGKLGRLPSEKPAIVVTMELEGKALKALQFQNFFCGLRRLGLLGQLVVFAMREADAEFARQAAPEATTLQDKRLTAAVEAVGKHLNVAYRNRIGKLVWASVLLEFGHEVIVSDTDSFWFDNPIPHLKSKEGDLVAMQDNCRLELNSGFLYYRVNNATRQMLRAALSTPKPGLIRRRYEIPTDNDQYLLNCAAAAFVASGQLQLHLLPKAEYLFGNPSKFCADPSRLMIWQSGGMTGLGRGDGNIFRACGLWDLSDGSTFNASALQGAKLSNSAVACLNASARPVPEELRESACAVVRERGFEQAKKTWS